MNAARLEKSERLQSEWREVPGFPGYEVSSAGEVRSVTFRNGKTSFRRKAPLVMKTTRCGHGRMYPALTLCRGGKVFTRRVHHVVLTAFHGERPSGMEAAHLNGDPTDNRAENLAWTTHKENVRMKERHGTSQRGERGGRAVLTDGKVVEMRRLRSKGLLVRELAEVFGVCKSQVSNIVKRRQWTHV